jgi:hypothetical protein
MAGYSGTPLLKKLGVAGGTRLALVGAPEDFSAELGALPVGACLLPKAVRPLDVVLFFARSKAELARRLGPLARKLAANGGLWVAWPKKASGVVTDLSEGVVRELGLALGLVDNKVCAVNDVWSGLRFVVPLSARGTWPPAAKARRGNPLT